MKNEKKPIVTIAQAAAAYLDVVRAARSENTARAYKNGLQIFARVLKEYWTDAESSPTENLREEAVGWMAAYLKNFSATTEQLYLQAVKGFYQYLDAEGLADVNMSRVSNLIRQRARRPGQRLPQFPRDEIENLLEFVNNITNKLSDNPEEHLRGLRDRAFLITLADTGLRVHEACGLRRGDMDWNEGRALVIGKGDRQAVVRFTSRAMRALKDYLAARAGLDGNSGRPLASLPLFARHDRGAGKKVKAMTTTTGRNIVTERVRQALGDDPAAASITPHSFRHYFVTTVLRGSGNLKLAQELARHKNIQVTQRYTHLSDEELDRGYREVFEEESYRLPGTSYRGEEEGNGVKSKK